MIFTTISSIKTFSLKNMIGIGIPFLIAFFAPIIAMVGAVCVLTIFDTITGIWAALKRGDKIHSRAMGRTVTKMLLYSLVILLAHIMEIVFIPWMPMVSLAAGYVALVEFRSNMENIGYITNIDVWNYLKDKIEIFKPKDTISKQ